MTENKCGYQLHIDLRYLFLMAALPCGGFYARCGRFVYHVLRQMHQQNLQMHQQIPADQVRE